MFSFNCENYSTSDMPKRPVQTGPGPVLDPSPKCQDQDQCCMILGRTRTAVRSSPRSFIGPRTGPSNTNCGLWVHQMGCRMDCHLTRRTWRLCQCKYMRMIKVVLTWYIWTDHFENVSNLGFHDCEVMIWSRTAGFDRGYLLKELQQVHCALQLCRVYIVIPSEFLITW